ncbi:MAG: hypothetical protein Q9223_002024 [Gallowayella weberi]
MLSRAKNQERAVRGQYDPLIAAISHRMAHELKGSERLMEWGEQFYRRAELMRERDEIIKECWADLDRIWYGKG